MKRFILSGGVLLGGIPLCMALLLPFTNIFAQYARITYPINRTVFQQKPNDVTPISLAFQIDPTRFAQDNGLSGGIPIYKVEKMDMKTGQTVISTPQSWAVTSLNSTLLGINLAKGWYKVTLGVYFSDPNAQFISELTSVKFGVGDVYFIVGQSNASGFDEKEFDNVQNYAQTYATTEQYDCISFVKSPKKIDNLVYSYENTNILGLPFNPQNTDINIPSVLSNLTNGTELDVNRIYPNGRGSWYWSQFAYRMAKDKDTPVMLFNIATPNTSTRDWGQNFNTNRYKQFRRTLQTYGNIFGAKAILWFQGENDTEAYHNAQRPHTPQNDVNHLDSNGIPDYDPDAPTFIANFKTFLQNLIAYSRGDFDANLTWYVSSLSLKTVPNITQNGNTPFDPLLENLICGSSNPTVIGIYKKLTSTDIKTQQASLFDSNIFAGVTTSDNINECDRADSLRIHFTGKGTNLSLQTMGNWWYDAVNTNYTSISVEGKTLLPITISQDGSNNYVLAGPRKASNQLYAKYFWVKNGNGVFDPSKVLSTQADFSTNTNFTAFPDFYICNVSDETDPNNFKLRACQPFVMPNNQDLLNNLRITNGSQDINQLSFSANNELKDFTVASENLIWDTADMPSWASLSVNNGGFQQTQVNITAQANNTGRPRTATLRVKQFNTSNDYQQTLSLYQASTACNDVNNSSLTPTNSSNEWQGFGTLQSTKSIAGNIIKIGGRTFINGLGTHANSTIKYNLAGKFITFHAFIGRDDGADGCGPNCGSGQTVVFKVKADGNLIFTSPNMGIATPAQEINLNITGINELKLIVEDGGDGIYGDHADWADAMFLCTASPCGNYLTLASPTDDLNSSTTKKAVVSITASNKINTGNVEYKAGNFILLEAGFKTENGAVFKATIPTNPCD